jgi:hypothetical protein
MEPAKHKDLIDLNIKELCYDLGYSSTREVTLFPYVTSTMLKDELKRSISYGFFSAYSKEIKLHIQKLSSLTFTVAFADHSSLLLEATAAGNSIWQSLND